MDIKFGDKYRHGKPIINGTYEYKGAKITPMADADTKEYVKSKIELGNMIMFDENPEDFIDKLRKGMEDYKIPTSPDYSFMGFEVKFVDND